jgi:hypothetical protein
MELTKDTELVAEMLFAPNEADEIKTRLREELSDDSDAVFSVFDTPESRERIWLSVIRKCNETLNPWDTWFELAKKDWRDLFMASGFGFDASEHLRWKKEVLSSRGDQLRYGSASTT